MTNDDPSPTAGRRRLLRRDAGVTAALFVLAVVIFAIAGTRTFIFDADHYWTIAWTYRSSGAFDLTSYSDQLRGYSFPLVLALLQGIGLATGGTAQLVVLLWNCTLLAAITTLLLPRVVRHVTGWERSSLWSTISGIVLVRVFWGGYAPYPLADVPAVTLLFVGVLLLARLSPGRAAAAGVALGVALNMRPSYVLAAALAIIVSAASAWVGPWAGEEAGDHPLRSRAARSAVTSLCCVLGILLALAPQAHINRVQHGATSFSTLDNGDLAALQFVHGLRYQRYMTTYDVERGAFGIFLCDPAGEELLQEAAAAGLRLRNPASYVRFLLAHPVEAVGIVTRRVGNGLFLESSSPYLEHAGAVSFALGTASALAVLIGGALLLRAFRPGPRLWRGLLLAVAAAPSLVTAISAMEGRFFLPVSLLAIGLVTTAPYRDLRSSAGSVTRTAAPVLLLLAAVLAITTAAFALESPPEDPTPCTQGPQERVRAG